MSRSPLHHEILTELNTFWASDVLTELYVPEGRYLVAISRVELFRFFALTSAVLFSLVVVITTWVANAPLRGGNGLYSTTVGQQKSMELPDGSVIQLNTDSQIKVGYNKEYRAIRIMQGEVHFDVSKNSERPFLVRAGSGTVRAVGTEFSIYLNKKDAAVLVTEGQVALATSDDSVNFEEKKRDGLVVLPVSDSVTTTFLGAGEAAILKNINAARIADKKEVVREPDIGLDEIGKRLAWREGVLHFSGEPLSQVVDELSRYTSITIDIVDPAIARIQVGGQVKIGESDSIFESLENNFGIKVTRVSYSRVQLSMARE